MELVQLVYHNHCKVVFGVLLIRYLVGLTDEICLHTVITQADTIVSVDRFSSFTQLRRVTAWLMRFARLTRKALTCT